MALVDNFVEISFGVGDRAHCTLILLLLVLAASFIHVSVVAFEYDVICVTTVSTERTMVSPCHLANPVVARITDIVYFLDECRFLAFVLAWNR